MSRPVYEHDADRAPDEDFLPGELRFLVASNRGRLLDARRTPVTVTSVAADKGSFEVQIEAFEDRGARWELPLEAIGRFQFAREGAHAAPRDLRELEAARKRFDRFGKPTPERRRGLGGDRGRRREPSAGRGHRRSGAGVR